MAVVVPALFSASLASLLTPPAKAPAAAADAQMAELRTLFSQESAAAARRKQEAKTAESRLAAVGAVRNFWPLPPRLQPHDIPVVTLDQTLTSDALEKLFNHECCAVHVRGFIGADTCAEITSRLDASSEDFSNWNIHASQSEGASASTEVDKIGLVATEALSSWDSFREYLMPSPRTSLDVLLPGGLNPFRTLFDELHALHPDGCRSSKLGRWPLPLGTFRRMYSSRGLLHADTATLLARAQGEFSANLYISTPPGRVEIREATAAASCCFEFDLPKLASQPVTLERIVGLKKAEAEMAEAATAMMPREEGSCS